MHFENITRESTSDNIIRQIKKKIGDGELKPGEKLPSERQLSEMLGVSRTSIREAIHALSFSGYLEVLQGKGAFVTQNAKKYDEISSLFSKISDFSLTSVMEVRIMMEGEFARIATLRASEEEVQKIITCYHNMEKTDTVRGFVLKDLEFHLMIAKATHNPLMNILMKIFGELLHKETNKIVECSKETRNQSLQVSKKLVEAIKKRDSQKAKELMIEHINIIDGAIK